MSAAQHPAQHPSVVDPAAVEPTITAPEASTDPIRPTGTDALTAESRPEVTGDSTTSSAIGVGAPEPTEKKVDNNKAVEIEAQPILEGVLGYKAPGILKSFRFVKHFFWLSDDAVEPQHLSGFLRSEKPDVGHHTAAYATQTGKGLLFYAKRVEDKTQPAGILDLSEATDVTKEGQLDFSFKIHGHKHTFEAPTHAERDSWLVSIGTKAADGKASRQGIIGSDGYKKHKEHFGNPTAGNAVSGVGRSKSRTKEAATDTVHEPVLATDGAASSKGQTEVTPHEHAKSRSRSRKRGSLFGTILGKKEDHEDNKELKKEEKLEKKEEKAEEKAVAKEIKAEEKAEKRADKDAHKQNGTAAAPFDAAAVAARVVDAPIVPVEGTTSSSTEGVASPSTAVNGASSAAPVSRETAPKASKRNSIFGTFFKRDSMTSAREGEVAPSVPAKDIETIPVSHTAPQLSGPVDTPVKDTTTGHKPHKVDTALAPASATEPGTRTSPTSKGGLFGFMNKKEAQHDVKKEVKAEEKAEHGTTPMASTGTTAPPASTGTQETNPATQPTTTTTTAATPEVLSRDRRRSSFFGTLGSKKERRSEATSDAEVTDGEGRKSTPSKLGSLFRKPSRAVKTTPPSSAPIQSSEAPAPISKDVPAVTTNGASVKAVHANGTTDQSNGDVVADNLTAEQHQTAVHASA